MKSIKVRLSVLVIAILCMGYIQAQGDIADPVLTEEFQCVEHLLFNKNLFWQKCGA